MKSYIFTLTLAIAAIATGAAAAEDFSIVVRQGTNEYYSASQTVDVDWFGAPSGDNYYFALTEVGNAIDATWHQAFPPNTYIFDSEGYNTVYAWVNEGDPQDGLNIVHQADDWIVYSQQVDPVIFPPVRTDTTFRTITVEWDTDYQSIGWVEYRIKDSGASWQVSEASEYTTSGHVVTIAGLSGNTEYELRICSNGAHIEHSASTNVDTDFVLAGLVDRIIMLDNDGNVIEDSIVVDADRLNGVYGLAVLDGIIYASSGKNSIEKYNLITGAHVGTLATEQDFRQVRIGPDGNIYAAAWGHLIRGWTPEGTQVFNHYLQGLWFTVGFDFGPFGYIYHAANVHHNAPPEGRFYKRTILEGGVYTTENYSRYSSPSASRNSVVFAPNGTLYGIDTSATGQIDKILPGGGEARRIAATVPNPGPGVQVFPNGLIHIPGTTANNIRRLDPANDQIDTWVAGLNQACYSVTYVHKDEPPAPPTRIWGFNVSDKTTGSKYWTQSADVNVEFSVIPADGTTIEGYMLTETPDEPGVNDDWQPAKPPEYTIQGAQGMVTIYAWVKDSNDDIAGAEFTIEYRVPVALTQSFVLAGQRGRIIKLDTEGTIIDAEFIVDPSYTYIYDVLGLAVHDGIIYASDASRGIQKYDLATGIFLGTFMTGFDFQQVKTSPDGNIYSAATSWNLIRGWTPEGMLVFAISGEDAGRQLRGLDFDELGNVYWGANSPKKYKKAMQTEGGVVVQEYAPYPEGITHSHTVAFAPDGTLYGFFSGAWFQPAGIYKIPPGGGVATTIVESMPSCGPGVDLFPDGKIYIPGANQAIYCLDPSDDSVSTWTSELGANTHSVAYVHIEPVEAPPTYAITFAVPDDIYAGAPAQVPVTLAEETTGTEPYDNVRIEIEASGPGAVSFAADDDTGSYSFVNQGEWGPAEGIELTPGYSRTTDWTLIFSQAGTYTVTFRCYELGTDETVVVGTEEIIVEAWALPGDANRDGAVDLLDLVFVRNRLFADLNEGDNRQADVNNDGTIDLEDLIMVRNNLGAKLQ